VEAAGESYGRRRRQLEEACGVCCGDSLPTVGLAWRLWATVEWHDESPCCSFLQVLEYYVTARGGNMLLTWIIVEDYMLHF